MLTSELAAQLRLAFDDDRDAETFLLRLERYGDDLLAGLRAVYGDQVEALQERLLEVMLHAYHARPAELRRLDEARLLRPDWLQRPEMVGYVAYADRFAETLKGVQGRLDYLEGLGVKYLHLMPLLKPREGENDGGYAVQDYRSVRPDLGTMDDLSALAQGLRGRGISLVLDLVLNHVAREHEWAVRARAGDPKYRAYFHIFPDRSGPDAFEATLPEIFPDFAPGNFSYDEAAQGWVWTTFNSYQWDLNWANPDVFLEFVDIILYLANRGVEVFRLDAIAFLWKRLGTDCQNQPEVHDLTRALRAAARIVAPAVAFKAEAIVAPADLIHYLGTRVHHGKVSDMAYHNSLM
ncbi:MAG: alpha-amylase family glycosyl hydrolase, partial [Deinococcota bacterium]